MLTFNGKTYAKNNAEFVNSLFNASGTCNGYYRRVRGGIKLFKMNRQLEALIVDRPNEKFVVSASIHNGKPRYMFGLCSTTESWLGLDGKCSTEHSAISNITEN